LTTSFLHRKLFLGFIVDFEGTIENAKNIARYAKEVVGATGVTLTKK
jgi:hypothetical protein